MNFNNLSQGGFGGGIMSNFSFVGGNNNNTNNDLMNNVDINDNLSELRSSQISISQRRCRNRGSKSKRKDDESNSSDDEYF